MNSGFIVPLFSSPADGWLAIRKADLSVREFYVRYVIPLALITPVCGFIGATQVGWPGACDADSPVRKLSGPKFFYG